MFFSHNFCLRNLLDQGINPIRSHIHVVSCGFIFENSDLLKTSEIPERVARKNGFSSIKFLLAAVLYSKQLDLYIFFFASGLSVNNAGNIRIKNR